ncbi:MAG: hypothetical protein ABSG37_11505 [Candidatus Limnocylindrales bacterium]|jgi:hypothetical protein
MSGTHASITRCGRSEAHVARISVHLDRLTQGHDPFGHLFAIERLARAARAEWSALKCHGGRTEGRR